MAHIHPDMAIENTYNYERPMSPKISIPQNSTKIENVSPNGDQIGKKPTEVVTNKDGSALIFEKENSLETSLKVSKYQL